MTRAPEPAARVIAGTEPQQPPRVPRWLTRLLRDLADPKIGLVSK